MPILAWLGESALMSSPIGAFLRLVGGALKGFFSSLTAQGWLGLVGCAALGWVALHQWGEARHWKKQSGQFEKLYRADEADLKRIAKQATDQKNKLDAANAKISAALKERHNEEVARNATDAAALRLSGPGKAACPGNPGPTPAASGHVDAAAAGGIAMGQVPDRAGARLIVMPFDDAIAFAQSHDDLLAEVKAWRDDDAQLRAAWPKSTQGK